MARALKVFRLPIGFHDAYVAAPSQKAAAEAWGTDVAVFSRGEAELVTDPKLTEAPLASPGAVVKRLRGTAAEHIGALGRSEESSEKAKPKPAKAKPPSVPRPSRAALDKAEATLAEAQAAARQEIGRREAELAKERAALEKKQRADFERLQARIDKAESAYREALQRWRDA